ncbi:MAG: hypothetical protein ACPGJV_13465 [Bacteriovoracaceae bacterium]
MKYTLALLTLQSFFLGSTVFANQNQEAFGESLDREYFTVSNREVEEVDSDVEFFTHRPNLKSVTATIATANKLIAIGTKVWSIVEKGRPVSTVNMKAQVAVLPETESTMLAFQQMQGWEYPITKVYEVVYKNFYGMKVVKFKYAVTFEHGGTYQGKGQYLNAVRIAASEVNVAWGFNFDASAEVVSISNRGTQEDPVASVQIKLNYRTKTIVSDSRTEESFSISGDGLINKMY